MYISSKNLTQILFYVHSCTSLEQTLLIHEWNVTHQQEPIHEQVKSHAAKERRRIRKLKLHPHSHQAEWPPSHTSLPKLNMTHTAFTTDCECTSLCLAPSGRHVLAGFSDGTIRLFDTTGRVQTMEMGRNSVGDHDGEKDEDLFDADEDDEGDEMKDGEKEESIRNQHLKNLKFQAFVERMKRAACASSSSSDENDVNGDKDLSTSIKKKKKIPSQRQTESLSSSSSCSPTNFSINGNNNKGIILGRIHPRGVYSKLITTVQIVPDGTYAFCGVLRGNVEMLAIDLSKLERWHNSYELSYSSYTNQAKSEQLQQPHQLTITQLETLCPVHMHADAKLRGFGACTRLRYSSTPEYRLLCGTGIKNVHLWSFRQTRSTQLSSSSARVGENLEMKWECLRTFPVPGRSVSLLQFRHVYSKVDKRWKVQGISKSDEMNVCTFDVSAEKEKEKSIVEEVPNSEHVRGGIYGSYGYGSGLLDVNTLSLVKVDDYSSASYNRTEMALEESQSKEYSSKDICRHDSRGVERRSRRSNRGNQRSIADVAGCDDGSHVVICTSDCSLYHLRHTSSFCSAEEKENKDPLLTNREDDGVDGLQQQHGIQRILSEYTTGVHSGGGKIIQMSVSRAGSKGTTILALATLENSSGEIRLEKLSGGTNRNGMHWGFLPGYGKHKRMRVSNEDYESQRSGMEVRKKQCSGSDRVVTTTSPAAIIATPSHKVERSKSASMVMPRTSDTNKNDTKIVVADPSPPTLKISSTSVSPRPFAFHRVETGSVPNVTPSPPQQHHHRRLHLHSGVKKYSPAHIAHARHAAAWTIAMKQQQIMSFRPLNSSPLTTQKNVKKKVSMKHICEAAKKKVAVVAHAPSKANGGKNSNVSSFSTKTAHKQKLLPYTSIIRTGVEKETVVGNTRKKKVQRTSSHKQNQLVQAKGTAPVPKAPISPTATVITKERIAVKVTPPHLSPKTTSHSFIREGMDRTLSDVMPSLNILQKRPNECRNILSDSRVRHVHAMQTNLYQQILRAARRQRRRSKSTSHLWEKTLAEYREEVNNLVEMQQLEAMCRPNKEKVKWMYPQVWDEVSAMVTPGKLLKMK